MSSENDGDDIGFDISDDDIYVPVAQRRAALLNNKKTNTKPASKAASPTSSQPNEQDLAKPQSSKTLLEEAQNVITEKAEQGKDFLFNRY